MSIPEPRRIVDVYPQPRTCEVCMAFRCSLIITLTLAAALLTGCGDGALGARHRDLPQFRFSESAASSVVELKWRDLERAELWPIDSTPLVARGGPDEDSIFLRMVYALRLPDGRIAAADRGGNRIRILTAAGALADTWGREGAGPGEYQWVSWLSTCDQRGLYAFDLLLARMTVLNWSGEVLDVFHVRPGGGSPNSHPVCNHRGIMAITGSVEYPESRSEGLYRPFVTVSVGRGDQPFRDLVRIPGRDYYRFPEGGGEGPLVDFGRKPVFALGDTTLYLATGDAFEIAEYGLDGSLLALIRGRDVPRARITAADLDQVRQEELAANQPQYHAQLERTLASMEWPTYKPVIEGLLVDSEGCLWVRHTMPDRPHLVWRVLTRSGRPAGVVLVPKDFTLTSADEHELVGYSESGLDGGRLLIYGYQRRSTPRC